MTSARTSYRFAAALAFFATFVLVWGMLGVGVLGEDGTRADMMYLPVLAIGFLGTLVARLRPPGMVRVMTFMAFGMAVVTLIALAMGLHHSPVSSVAEIVGLNGFFISMFIGSAWLFRQANLQRA